MKTCKNCKFPFGQFELSSVIRAYAIIDVFRFLILLGPMLSLFYACTNIRPMSPRAVVGGAKHNAEDYVLYYSNRSSLSQTEQDMLANVQKSCSKDYRDNLPTLWNQGRPILYKALYLQGIAMVLPTTSAVAFLVLQKKDLLSSALALAHFTFEVLSSVLSYFGAYFISTEQLCFLGHFSPTLNVPLLLWILATFFSFFYKAGVLYSLYLYLRNNCNGKSLNYHNPSPAEELQSYLQELRSLGITPKVKIDLPEDRSKLDWEFVNTTIKKILHEVRVQVAELHRDDPVVDGILKSGKLQGQGPRSGRKRTGSNASVGTNFGTGPNVLKIARMMASKNAEYKLLKQHQHSHHHHGKGAQAEGNKDDVEVILPQPNFRFDPDY